MATLPYMQFYVGDYLADTSHLSTTEHGAYLLLIFAYWRNGGPLPNDDERLARIAGLSLSEWEVAANTIKAFFIVEGVELIHNRIEKDLCAAKIKSDRAKTAIANRWTENSKTPKRNTDVKQNVIQRSGNTNVIPYQNQNSESESELETEKTHSGGFATVARRSANGGAKKTRSPEDSALYKRVQDRFKSEYGQFEKGLYAKEGAATWGLIEKARSREKEHAEDFLFTAITAFARLRDSDQFFRKQPMLPSSLNASGIWPRVIETMRVTKAAANPFVTGDIPKSITGGAGHGD